MNEPLILCDNLVKIYKQNDIEVVALQGLDLRVQAGEVMALVGSSGSGKTTLMNVLGGLDRPSAGRALVAGNDLLKLSEAALTAYRRRYVGFVWQQKARNLIAYLDAEQNISMPMTLSGVSPRARREWTDELLNAIALTGRKHHRLAQLSGGEQQRVAIAVALANHPALLLADEPTGELDSNTAETIYGLFHELNRRFGLTVVIVSHDSQVSRYVNRVVAIRDGKTSSETVRRTKNQEPENQERGNQHQASQNPAAYNMQHASEFEELVMLDGAGRLQVPREIRERYGIGDRVVLEETAEGLLLRPSAGSAAPASAATPRLTEPDAPPPPKKGVFGRAAGMLRRK